MGRPKNTSDGINEISHSARTFYLYDKNYNYVIGIVGEYEKKSKKMGIGRVVDIIVTNARLKEVVPILPEKEEKEDLKIKGSCNYKATGENRNYLIDLKTKYIQSGKVSGKFGIVEVIKLIIQEARKK